MRMDRRDCLRLGAAAGAGAALTGCSRLARRFVTPSTPDVASLPAAGADPIVRLLNRAGFGPAPGQVRAVLAAGASAYVDAQLAPGDDEDAVLAVRLAPLETLSGNPVETLDEPREEVIRQIQQAALLRAVYSPYQLRERMVDFWTNHFNVYSRKGLGAFYKPTDELRVVRAHALGSFADMLRASAHSPAMLMYLDNQVNRVGRANENYARELMELHTLGVHGGYAQSDVQEVARCFTGWTVETRFLRPRGRFRFDPELHDNGPKVVLGHRIPAAVDPADAVTYRGQQIPAGQLDGERVLEILADHPATAAFIGGKIAAYFLGDSSGGWPQRLAAAFRESGGDIAAMLRPLLNSHDLALSRPIAKRPFDFVASALRALNADTDGGPPVLDHIRAMGQPTYEWPMPDGYPDGASAWTGSLLARWNFALALATGSISGTALDLDELMRLNGAASDSVAVDALIEIVLARNADASDVGATRAALHKFMREAPRNGPGAAPATAQAAALLLASPRFQWR